MQFFVGPLKADIHPRIKSRSRICSRERFSTVAFLSEPQLIIDDQLMKEFLLTKYLEANFDKFIDWTLADQTTILLNCNLTTIHMIS